MNLDALAEKLMMGLAWRRVTREEIDAALAQVRADALEEAEKWHEGQERSHHALRCEYLKRDMQENARGSYTNEILHRICASHFRSLKEKP